MKNALMIILLMIFPTGVAAQQSAPAAKEMTLREAVEYALQHSPDLMVAAAETRRREGIVTSARAGLLPQVDLMSDVSRSRFDRGYPAGTPPQILRFDNTLYTEGAELKFLVWDFRQTELELAAARQRVLAANASLDRRKQEVIFEIARLYLQTLTFNDLAEAAESTRKSLQALLQQTQELVQAGRAVPTDAMKVETRLAQIESDLATLESGRRASLSALAAVMGYEGDLPRLVYSSPEKTAVPPPTESDVELLRAALDHRPDLSSQTHEWEAASRLESAAHRSLWPRIDVRASVYEYASNSPASFISFIGRFLPNLNLSGSGPGNAATDWFLGVHVTFPLFDGGRRRGQIQSAAAQKELAQAAVDKLQSQIRREVRTALADLESAQARVRATEQSVAQAEQVLRNERLKYEAGRSVINFVLDAEAALLTNQSLWRQAQRSVSIAALALDLSVGRISPSSVP